MRLHVAFFFAGNIVFNVIGSTLMKLAANSVKGVPINSLKAVLFNLILNPLLIFGASSYVLSLIMYLIVLQQVNLSIAYPIITACTAILVNISAQLLLQERISWSQFLGCAIIVFGIYLMVKK